MKPSLRWSTSAPSLKGRGLQGMILMKLIYLDSGRFPTEKAHGYQIAKMCEAFGICGDEVELVISSRKNPIIENPFQYYGLKHNFRVTKIKSIDLVNVVPKFGTWISRLSFIFSAKKYLIGREYDILYFRDHMTGLFFRDFVLELHALPKKVRFFDLMVWKRAKKIVVLTSFIKERMVKSGIAAEKIIVAADAVDLEKFKVKSEKFKVREKLKLPLHKKIIGYVGSFHTVGMEKGIATILEALKLLQNPKVIFLAVGGDKISIEKYLAEAARLKVAERVIFQGRIAATDIPNFLSACDVLLMPFPKNEHYAYFMSPLKMFEYMAAGKPIVTSDLPSIREVLDEQSAVFVEPGNARSLALGIDRVLEDENLARRISAKAAEMVKGYTWERRAKNILDFIPHLSPADEKN